MCVQLVKSDDEEISKERTRQALRERAALPVLAPRYLPPCLPNAGSDFARIEMQLVMKSGRQPGKNRKGRSSEPEVKANEDFLNIDRRRDGCVVEDE